MRSTHILIFIALAALGVSATYAQLPNGYPNTPRQKLSLNQSWQFHLGDAEAKYYEDTAGAEWEEVHLPHTLALTSLALDGLQDEKTQLIFHRQVAWYRKAIEVTADPDKKVFLEFEGAHQITDLGVNGRHVGQHSVGGYTPFHFDISDFVERGASNQITLRLDNRRQEHVPPDPGPFDYVKFSGLYRDVYLVETDPLHITFNWEALHAGVNITTPTVDPVNMNTSISVKTVVRNEYDRPQVCQLITRIIDQEGLVVLKLKQAATIPAGQDHEFDQIGSIEDNLHLWDTKDPYLYRVNSLVMMDGKEMDCLENRLGVRKFALDPVRGFVLNNKPIKLLGYNRHQHHAYIGDALPNSLHRKDMLQFK
ncbi:MAG: sugar-binding domain-containing protein, partial [Bacteroidota bacterium]